MRSEEAWQLDGRNLNGIGRNLEACGVLQQPELRASDIATKTTRLQQTPMKISFGSLKAPKQWNAKQYDSNAKHMPV
ncbi:hypothetical protein STEG23_023212 [Scotinomys teguina]